MGFARQVILFGPPGSGKGTQAKRLSQHLSLPYCSTGALLREQEHSGSALGNQVHLFLKEGNYVPDQLIAELIVSWIKERNGACILDGFPRTLPQAELLEGWRLSYDWAEPIVLALEVPLNLLKDRVARRVGCDRCGNVWSAGECPERCPECAGPLLTRDDDSFELFLARYGEYEKKTLPLLPFYESKNRVKRINGEGSADAVFDRVLGAL